MLKANEQIIITELTQNNSSILYLYIFSFFNIIQSKGYLSPWEVGDFINIGLSHHVTAYFNITFLRRIPEGGHL